jgi:hypothetical protein
LQHALPRLADHGKRLRQQRIERLALGDALLELGRLGLQRLVGKRGRRRLQRVDLAYDGAVLLEQSLVRYRMRVRILIIVFRDVGAGAKKGGEDRLPIFPG